jgi:hypothetical protein
MLNEHYWFCQPHAADYNRNWNFFAGMSESEVRARMEQSALGDRPTWDFKAGKNSRESAAAARGFATGDGFRDPFDLFGRTSASRASEAPARRNLGKLERTALADLDLDEDADAARIRARYTELVKLCHPDANGGDRSAEAKLQRTIRAYQVLRKAKMV